MLAEYLIATCVGLPAATRVQDSTPGLLHPVEIRALVVRPSELDILRDALSIGAAMDRLAEIGFDAVVPLAWERGRSLVESPALAAIGLEGVNAFPGRDVLQEFVFEAHRAGLEVLVGLDGALTLDTNAQPPAKFPLANGAKDRPDPRNAAVRAASRAFALELARAAEIDGFVLWSGLTAFTREESIDPAAKDPLAAAHAEFTAWREELNAFDKSLVVGWAAADPRYAYPSDAKGLDFLLFPRGAKDIPKPLSTWMGEKPGRAARILALDEKLDPDAFEKQLATAREKPYAGEMMSPFAALEARDRALADVLTEGFEAPYYARAKLPWRDGVAWRPAAERIPLVNDSGTFIQVEGDIGYSRLEAGLPGNASWALKPVVKGPHDLWVYLPPSVDELPELKFLITTDPRRVVKVVLPAAVPRGWTRIGPALFSSDRKEDVLRLEIPPGGTKPIAIGPLVALPHRRPDGR